MKRLFYAAVAAVALVASVPVANAAPFMIDNVGSGGRRTAVLGNNDVAAPVFTDTFQLTFAQAGLVSFSLSEVGFDPENNLEFTSATFSQGGLSRTFDRFSGPGGEPDFGSLLNAAVSVGSALLTIMGTNGGNGVYAGTLAFRTAAMPPVPIPGALLLMGTVLVGGAGFAKLRKKSARQIA